MLHTVRSHRFDDIAFLTAKQDTNRRVKFSRTVALLTTKHTFIAGILMRKVFVSSLCRLVALMAEAVVVENTQSQPSQYGQFTN